MIVVDFSKRGADGAWTSKRVEIPETRDPFEVCDRARRAVFPGVELDASRAAPASEFPRGEERTVEDASPAPESRRTEDEPAPAPAASPAPALRVPSQAYVKARWTGVLTVLEAKVLSAWDDDRSVATSARAIADQKGLDLADVERAIARLAELKFAAVRGEDVALTPELAA